MLSMLGKHSNKDQLVLFSCLGVARHKRYSVDEVPGSKDAGALNCHPGSHPLPQ